MFARGRAGAALLATAVLIGCAPVDRTSSDGSLGEEETISELAELERENERVILEFIEAWSRLDPVELASFFTEDGIYHNMPGGPVQGRDNVEALIRGFSASWTETTWDVRTIVSKGNVVMAERLDRTKAGDKTVDLACLGVFELEDGKIEEWRDYFDQGTYVRAMS